MQSYSYSSIQPSMARLCAGLLAACVYGVGALAATAAEEPASPPAGSGTMAPGAMGQGMTGQGQMGQGMGGMMSSETMMRIDPLAMLNLTEEQRTKINKLRNEQRAKDLAAFGKIMDERAKLPDLYRTEPLDAKKIGAAYGAIATLQQKMIEGNIEVWNAVRAVLTKEQKEQISQWQRNMGAGMQPGGMGGMGGGMGGMGGMGMMGGGMGGMGMMGGGMGGMGGMGMGGMGGMGMGGMGGMGMGGMGGMGMGGGTMGPGSTGSAPRGDMGTGTTNR